MKIFFALLLFSSVVLFFVHFPNQRKDSPKVLIPEAPLPGIYLGDTSICIDKKCLQGTNIFLELLNTEKHTQVYVWNEEFFHESTSTEEDLTKRLTFVGFDGEDKFYAPIDKRDILYQKSNLLTDLEGKTFLKEGDYSLYPLLFWKNSKGEWYELVNKDFIRPMD